MEVRAALTNRKARGLALGGLVTFFGTWCLLSYGGLVPTIILPSPTDVVKAFPVLHFEEALVRSALASLYRVSMGFLLSALVAIPLGLLMGTFPAIKYFCSPILDPLRFLPISALVPLFIVWFGIGIESKMALVVFTVFFIVYFAAHSGVRALDAKLVQMAQIMGANERQVARHIVLPSAVPYIFTGFRIAMPYAIGGAVIAELLSANRGLGYLIQLKAMDFDTTGVFVALVATACVSIGGNWCVNAVEARLLRWRPPADVALQAAAGG